MGEKCVRIIKLIIYYLYKQGSVAGSRRLVENYHLYTDTKIISFISSNLLRNDINNKKICAEKLNEPVNIYEDTLLHYAVYHRRKQLIEYLINHGAIQQKLINVNNPR